jgi:hypothetical protein
MMMKYCPKLKAMLKSEENFSQKNFLKFLANSFPKKNNEIAYSYLLKIMMNLFVTTHECVIGLVTILKQN